MVQSLGDFMWDTGGLNYPSDFLLTLKILGFKEHCYILERPFFFLQKRIALNVSIFISKTLERDWLRRGFVFPKEHKYKCLDQITFKNGRKIPLDKALPLGLKFSFQNILGVEDL